MAETTLTVQSIAAAGSAPTYGSANTDGSKAPVDDQGRTFLHVKNTNGSARNLTLVAQKPSAQVPGVGAVTLSNKTVNVPATTGDVMIPIEPYFIDLNGYAHWTYDAVSGVTIAAIKLARLAPV